MLRPLTQQNRPMKTSNHDLWIIRHGRGEESRSGGGLIYAGIQLFSALVIKCPSSEHFGFVLAVLRSYRIHKAFRACTPKHQLDDVERAVGNRSHPTFFSISITIIARIFTSPWIRISHHIVCLVDFFCFISRGERRNKERSESNLNLWHHLFYQVQPDKKEAESEVTAQ